MTKIHIISDIHLEINKSYIHTQPDCDIVLLAGDLIPGDRNFGIEWLKATFNVPIFYIAGNHEYYAYPKSFNSIDKQIQYNAENNNIHFLTNETAVFNNLRILGTTLWTNYNLFGNKIEAIEYGRRGMNDYYYSGYGNSGFHLTPEDTIIEHEMAIEFIKNELEKPFDGKTIVLTHHCPHKNSIHQRYKTELLTAAFCTDLSEIFANYKIDYWIHGHTHCSFDYMVGDTRVICNPLGYQRKNGEFENPNFKKDLVINV